MIAIQFPPPDFKIVTEGGNQLIFDAYRKRYVVLTPEEWVRQNFLNFLSKIKSYPPSLMGVEKEIFLGEMKKRCDIIVYNRNSKPWMIVECKEMDVPLNLAVLEQIVRYNMALPVSYLVITNGTNTFCCKLKGAHDVPEFVADLPVFE
ncbi:type I restriction enzyme HsdR N-terminal domain-containing protein [Chitinophaga horti]|uniref:Type I restriction enzyme HsdR N-terminal domain-containing protein n=1 Tax=Chitinophaga horti TaxID=2920382 RepID=A0ABY6J1S8_9BACT|nr:type I restriction enzyme HsdR N-terminal domain-containing protein [Chitinophaga horti]UYQ93605.1 type I restriction enzyme HsdR N-terminal domain-containing protein [Chitinophaga horti]